jgi:hypothetical protein
MRQNQPETRIQATGDERGPNMTTSPVFDKNENQKVLFVFSSSYFAFRMYTSAIKQEGLC